jgi:hypothetical protein
MRGTKRKSRKKQHSVSNDSGVGLFTSVLTYPKLNAISTTTTTNLVRECMRAARALCENRAGNDVGVVVL